MEPRVQGAWEQCLVLTCDKLLSNFAVNFNLRLYNVARGFNSPGFSFENVGGGSASAKKRPSKRIARPSRGGKK
jgi:hypothetical protein